ncbi:MAG: zinc ribbon domain-containing protein [Actinomycetota bacterium]|nr:zinc ribbon domain-containing protein [Actinomycetota bacterium]
METPSSRSAPQAPPLAASVRCPECGGANPPGAEWCGQCFARFHKPEEAASSEVDPVISSELLSDLAAEEAPPAPPPPPSPRPRSTEVKTGDGTFSVTDEGINWTCKKCDTTNEFSSNICIVCGATFAEAIKPPEDPKPQKDANTAALVSLFLPGAGHAYLGMWGQAVARAIISLWVVAVAIFSVAQEAATARIMGVLFGIVGVGLWVVAAHDSYREAQGSSRLVILRQKFLLYLVLGLLLLSVVMVFSTAVGTRG